MSTTHRQLAEIVDGEIVIRLTADAAQFAAENSEYFFRCKEGGDPLMVTDKNLLLKSMRNALNREAEDGSTPVIRMFDDALEHLCEQGDEGVESVNL